MVRSVGAVPSPDPRVPEILPPSLVQAQDGAGTTHGGTYAILGNREMTLVVDSFTNAPRTLHTTSFA